MIVNSGNLHRYSFRIPVVLLKELNNPEFLCSFLQHAILKILNQLNPISLNNFKQ